MDKMASEPLTVDSLPNELLISILSPIETPSLLPLAAINHRFHALVLRLLHHRLAQVVALPEHQLILECYHPSAKQSTPWLECDYLGTDGLDSPSPGTSNVGPERVTGPEDQLSLRELKQLYSRFRPVKQEQDRRPRTRYPRRSSTVAQTQSQQQLDGGGGSASGSAASATKHEQHAEPELASHDIYLDECELFSQLITVTNLVKVVPQRGLFVSHVNVSDGLIRVWRDWLEAKAAAETGPDGREAILWADSGKNVGLRFRVVEKADLVRPLLLRPDEDVPVSYRLEYEELLVRTNQLLLMKEKSDAQEGTVEGNAMILASI